MKKLYLIFVLALAVLPAVYGAEIGNLPDKNGFGLAVKADFSERQIKPRDSFAVLDSSQVYGIQASTNLVKINDFDAAEKTSAVYLKPSFSFAFLEGALPLQIYGKVGSVSGQQDWYNVQTTEYYANESEYNSSCSRYSRIPASSIGGPRWDSGNGFGSYYGIGAKLAYEIKDGLKIGIDLQLTASKFKKDTLLFKDESYNKYEYGNDKYEYSSLNEAKITNYKVLEPQVALAVSKNLDDFSVYGGAIYSSYKGKVKGNGKYATVSCYNGNEILEETNNDFAFKTKSKHNLGLFLGGDYNISKNFALNAEFAAGNEQRITVGGLCKF